LHNIQTLIRAYEDAVAAGVGCAIATVVRVTGSAFRQPGARMFIGGGGDVRGTISGGCLEKDVVLRAQSVIAGGSAEVLEYGLSGSEDDVVFGLGAGCNGTIEVLVEPVESAIATFTFINALRASRQSGVIATVIGSSVQAKSSIGQRRFFSLTDIAGEQAAENPLFDERLKEQLENEVNSAIAYKRSIWRTIEVGAETITIFFEFLSPPIKLIVCGFGTDALEVAALSTHLNWDAPLCTLRSTNPSVVVPNRVIAGENDLASELKQGDNVAALVMTHNYAHDKELLRFLCDFQLDYIGVLGPKHRWQRLMQDLQAEGQADTQRLATVFSPVGLDIGAETEIEIALSIVAEVQAVLSARTGGMLRRRKTPIHDRVETDDALNTSDGYSQCRQ
jgi:xanthine dehydrogenase accessory factor